MNNDLLIELGCEDLPARYVQPLAEALSSGVAAGLAKRGIALGKVESFATPRRIAVLIKAVAAQQPDQSIDRLGPAVMAAFKDGRPTPAALGFAKSCGVDLSALGEKDGKLYFSTMAAGRATHELLPEIFEDTLKQMDQLVPKRMRWGSGDETFVRPVQWIVALLGSKVVPISRFGLKSGNKTYGHRFHAPKAIVLKSPAEYEKKLKAARVWADFASRRSQIQKQIEAEAKKLNGAVHRNDALLDEVTALVEWPVALHGRMEERFLKLPPEVVIATIEHNQRYFPVFSGPVSGSSGKLLPAFIAVSNIESRDATQVVVGNERVVRPRLSDALFFWDRDRIKALSANVAALGRVSFQQKLGSLADKSQRIVVISSKIAEVAHVDAGVVRRAAELCKADLVTRMVYEFPELQGVMGGYYAKSSGETDEVAVAIREHYQPTQAGTPIPTNPAGRILALADKLDTLAGIFAIGQKPTASKDPYGLRRAAIGVLRIVREAALPLNLGVMIKDALDVQPVTDEARLKASIYLWEFFEDRYKNLLVGSQITLGGPVVTPEQFEAVLAKSNLSDALSDVTAKIQASYTSPITYPLDFECRLQALHSFLALPAAAKLAAAHKRIRNILRGAADPATLACDPTKFVEAPEKALYQETLRLKAVVATLSDHHDYAEALARLAEIQPAVDLFFDTTMVMAEDHELRANRLALLSELDALCRAVADISCLPG